MIIRLMKPEDARPLRTLVMRYLKDTYEQGGDFPPTLENAANFVQHGIQGAAEMDPCLVAEEEGKVVGFVMGRGVFFPGMTTRDNTIRSWGSFVLPEYRGQKIAIKLFMVLGRLARQKGYTRVLGFTHGTGYAENGLRAIKAIAGMKEIGKVLMWNLAAPRAQEVPVGAGVPVMDVVETPAVTG
jgi:predicted N-acetyltransferase YhbS